MESQQFDALVRRALGVSSRRGVVRTGVGTLLATALAAMGVRPMAETEAKSRAQRRTGPRGKKGDHKGRRGPRGHQGRHGRPGPPATPPTCPATRPVTCGSGCCPNEFPLCCETAFNPVITHVCSPASHTCCSVASGGGSCGGVFPLCCPGSVAFPEGVCVPASATCCTPEEGGGACPESAPNCCPAFPGQSHGECARDDEVCCPESAGGDLCPAAAPKCCPPELGLGCCLEDQDCCVIDDDCGPGQVCDFDGCCVPDAPSPPAAAARAGGRTPGADRIGVERFGKPAR